jgi:PKD repeat protein
MTRKLIVLLAFTLAVLASKPASAAEFLADCRGAVKWNSSTVTWRPSLTSFPLNSPWYQSLDAARVAWNSYSPGGNYRINYTWETSTISSNTDNRNSIVMPAPSGWIWTAGATATTLFRRSMCYTWPGPDANWVEMDTIFNPNVPWENSLNPVMPQMPPYSPAYNSTLVALHEAGHGMGLDHENDLLATMNASYPNGGVIGTRNDVHPHADDTHGNRSLYGVSGTQRDLAAYAYRTLLPDFPGNSQVIPAPASANRNAPVSFQFSVENRGTTNQSSIPVYFYLSPTRNVTTSSVYLGSTTLSMNFGASITGTATVFIPATAATGSQYLGWIIDPLNGIVESDEGNNGVSLASPTVINVNRAPTACFTYTPTSGPAPLYVQFDASCSTDADGNPVTYSWDFGDGTTASGSFAEYEFYTQGYYAVTLTVTDSNGASSTVTHFISVTAGGSNCGTPRCLDDPL